MKCECFGRKRALSMPPNKRSCTPSIAGGTFALRNLSAFISCCGIGYIHHRLLLKFFYLLINVDRHLHPVHLRVIELWSIFSLLFLDFSFRGHLVGCNLAWKNNFYVGLSCLIWKRRKRDGKKVDGSHAYFLDGQDRACHYIALKRYKIGKHSFSTAHRRCFAWTVSTTWKWIDVCKLQMIQLGLISLFPWYGWGR